MEPLLKNLQVAAGAGAAVANVVGKPIGNPVRDRIVADILFQLTSSTACSESHVPVAPGVRLPYQRVRPESVKTAGRPDLHTDESA
jgi:hypothetical protein